MSEVLRVPEGEPIPTIERLDVWFKKRLAKARGGDEEQAIRDEWAATRMRLYRRLPLPEPETFPTIERLHKVFKRKIAKAGSKEEASTIRQEWEAAEARFWAEEEQRKDAATKAIEDANKERKARDQAEAAAIEEARRAYGYPAGAGFGLSHPDG